MGESLLFHLLRSMGVCGGGVGEILDRTAHTGVAWLRYGFGSPEAPHLRGSVWADRSGVESTIHGGRRADIEQTSGELNIGCQASKTLTSTLSRAKLGGRCRPRTSFRPGRMPPGPHASRAAVATLPVACASLSLGLASSQDWRLPSEASI